MSRKRSVFLIAFLSAISLLALATAAFAHVDVTLRDGNGASVTATTPYSPKNTCGGCHFNCSTGAYSTDKATWCDGSAGKQQKLCTTLGNCPDYESLATIETSHIQGYANSSKLVTFQTYSVTSAAHGASVGLHSRQGQNETLTAAQRTIWGAPAFISSPGMFGRY